MMQFRTYGSIIRMTVDLVTLILSFKSVHRLNLLRILRHA